ncbi:MAG TPA: hypothetical protein VIG24_07590 [Acidimicrobiia bacterium]
MSAYTLDASAPTNDAYPTRCPDCDRPVERLSVFPAGRCIDCHAAITPPVTDARELVRIWGGVAR